ncbi:hypothetical protein CBG53_10425 [Porphyromonas gingivalis]|nr:hypothetical protein CBG53_10425 [Porphyromonas gingivalis]
MVLTVGFVLFFLYAFHRNDWHLPGYLFVEGSLLVKLLHNVFMWGSLLSSKHLTYSILVVP